MHKLTNSIFKASEKTVIVAHHGYTLRHNLALAPACPVLSEEPLMTVYTSLMEQDPWWSRATAVTCDKCCRDKDLESKGSNYCPDPQPTERKAKVFSGFPSVAS